jgi:hypothetical protein
MIEYRVLGAFGIANGSSGDGDGPSVGGSRQRRLLAMLLINRNAVVSSASAATAPLSAGSTSEPTGHSSCPPAPTALCASGALQLDDLASIAEAKPTRGFTTAECRRYLHVDRCPGGGP